MSTPNYRKSSDALVQAWFLYKEYNRLSGLSSAVINFVAGYNAAMNEAKPKVAYDDDILIEVEGVDHKGDPYTEYGFHDGSIVTVQFGEIFFAGNHALPARYSLNRLWYYVDTPPGTVDPLAWAATQYHRTYIEKASNDNG